MENGLNTNSTATSDVVAGFISDARVEGSLLRRMEHLSDGERLVVSELLSFLKPSANTLRAYFELADAISSRDEVSFVELLTHSAVSQILADKDLSRKEKQKQLRLHLERLRYPTISKIQDELNRCVSELRQSVGLKVELPKDLEGDRLTLSVSAADPSEFGAIGLRLQQMSTHPSLARIYQLLRGETGVDDA